MFSMITNPNSGSKMNYMKLSQEFLAIVRKSPELRYSLGPAL